MNLRSPNMKKRIRRGDPQRQSYWNGVVRRWREGGQTVRAFCRAEGVRESAFYFWRRELTRRGPHAAVNGSRTQASPATPVQRMSRRHRPTPSFLPVQVVEPSVPESSRGVEIILEHGHTVRVQAGFDRQTLADVLEVLEVRPC
jgi:transposase-like protein